MYRKSFLYVPRTAEAMTIVFFQLDRFFDRRHGKKQVRIQAIQFGGQAAIAHGYVGETSGGAEVVDARGRIELVRI